MFFGPQAKKGSDGFGELLCDEDSAVGVMTVVTLCDGNVTNRHDVTVNLPNMTVPLKTVTDILLTFYCGVCTHSRCTYEFHGVLIDSRMCPSHPGTHECHIPPQYAHPVLAAGRRGTYTACGCLGHP